MVATLPDGLLTPYGNDNDFAIIFTFKINRLYENHFSAKKNHFQYNSLKYLVCFPGIVILQISFLGIIPFS